MPGPSPFDLPQDHLFGPNNLPYGVFSRKDADTWPDAPREASQRRGRHRRIGVRYGDHVLDAGAAATALGSPEAELLMEPVLNPLMAAGHSLWRAVHADLRLWLTSPAHRSVVQPLLFPLEAVTLHLPFEVADYVDFYSSEHHAANVGRFFRPEGDPLPPNWKHLPIGYHGRSGTVVVSGTPVVRPSGQRRPPSAVAPLFGPSHRLDFEAEVGFVVGVPSSLGEPVPQSAFREHVFGVCLVNDWSARDLQAWESMPLGPFLGKSFATSVSAWVTPLDALETARVRPPVRTHPLLPYLDDSEAEPGGLDLRLSVAVNGHTVASPPFSAMYWTAAQQLAHMTVNGASLRTGDFFASGTVSGPEAGQRGCLLELTSSGRDPVELTSSGRDPVDLPGGKRTFLEDGDEVTITGWAPGPHGTRIGLGEVSGRLMPTGA